MAQIKYYYGCLRIRGRAEYRCFIDTRYSPSYSTMGGVGPHLGQKHGIHLLERFVGDQFPPIV